MVKTLKLLNGLVNKKVPNKLSIVRETPSHLPVFTQVWGWIGQRGSGKTSSLINLLMAYEKHNSLDRIFLISPTAEANAFHHLKTLSPEDTYEDVDDVLNAIRDVHDKVVQEGEDWEDFQLKKMVWEEFKKLDEEDWEHMDDEIISLLEDMNWEKPKWKYAKEQKPSLLLILDDLSHSKLYRGNKANIFSNMLLRNRHLGKIGLNIHLLVQNWKGGIPRFARSNLSQIALYRTMDMKALKDMWEETLQGTLTFEDFLALHKKATEETPHDFLLIDYNKTSKHPSMFRKNFNEFLV